MKFEAEEVNRCNLGHRNLPDATTCGWCGAPLSPVLSTTYSTGLIPPILLCLALSVLALAVLFFPLVSLSSWGDRGGGIGWFGFTGSLYRPFNSPTPSPYWPSGLAPVVLALFAAILLAVLTTLLFRKRTWARKSLIVLTGAIWGIGAATYFATISEASLIGDAVQKEIDSGQFQSLTLLEPTVDYGASNWMVFVAWLILGAAGLSILFANRTK